MKPNNKPRIAEIKMPFNAVLLIKHKENCKFENRSIKDLKSQTANQLKLIKNSSSLENSSAKIKNKLEELKNEMKIYSNFYFEYDKELSFYKNNLDLEVEMNKIVFKSQSESTQNNLKKAIAFKYSKIKPNDHIQQHKPQEKAIEKKSESTKEFMILSTDPNEEEQTENINHVDLSYYSSSFNNNQLNQQQDDSHNKISKESLLYFKQSINNINMDNSLCFNYIEASNYDVTQAIHKYIETKYNTGKIKINLRTSSKNYATDLKVFDKIEEIFNIIYNTFQLYSIEVYIDKSKQDLHNLMTNGVNYIGGLNLEHGDILIVKEIN